MGPLSGTRVVEVAGIGPAPFCGMVFSDLGAEVTLIERRTRGPNAPDLGERDSPENEFYKRGKRSIALDLKKPESVNVVLELAERADVLIEGFRPGVMERLGLGPAVCHARNPKLVYARQTGWGQSGPLASAAGHDINYIALAGALYYTGHDGEAPFTPPTLIGDIAGGALTLAIGILAALRHAGVSGEGQIVDGAIVDGTVYQMILLAVMHETGHLREPRGSSLFSAGAPWYQSFECADGEYVTIGSVEPQFYQLLIEKCRLQEDPLFLDQYAQDDWPLALAKLRDLFKTRTRTEWSEVLEGTDVCFAPVLSYPEAQSHPHNVARQNFVDVDGKVQPAPAPKFSRTPAQPGKVPVAGEHTDRILEELGYSASEIRSLRREGVC